MANKPKPLNLKNLAKYAMKASSNKLVIFILAFAVIGSISLLAIHAASPSAFVQPEEGTVNAPAVNGSDANASNTGYVQFNKSGGSGTTPSSVTTTAIVEGYQVTWTPAQTGLYTNYEVSVDPSGAEGIVPSMQWVTANATSAQFIGVTQAAGADGTWNNTVFGVARRARVRGYNASTNTYGPYSAYSSSVTPNASTPIRIFGAQNPDGTSVGVPASATLTDYTGPMSGLGTQTISNKIVTGGISVATTGSPVVTFVNCLFLPGTVDRINGTYQGDAQIAAQSLSGPGNGKVIIQHSQIWGGGAGGFEAGIAYHDFTITNSIFGGHVHNQQVSGANVVMTDDWDSSIAFYANKPEIAAYSHRDSMQIVQGSGITVTRVWFNLNADNNAACQCQADQGNISNVDLESNWWVGGAYSVRFRDSGFSASILAPNYLNNNRWAIFPYGYYAPNAGSANNTDIQLKNDSVLTVSGSLTWGPNPVKPGGLAN